MSLNKLCKVCNSPVTKFVKSTNCFWDWCSNKCMGRDPEILAKKQATNIRKFGSHPMQSVDCKNKLKNTFLKNFGVDNPSKSDVVKHKMRETFLKNYGVDNPSKDPAIVKKIKDLAIEKHATIGAEIISKRRTTNLEKYGVLTNKHTHILPESLKLMKDVDWLEYQHCVLKKSLTQIASELGVSATPLSGILHYYNIHITRHQQISKVHLEILNFIKQIYYNKIIENTRDIISPLELDIYLPNIKLAIEINGVYWHSEDRGKDKHYHLSKTSQCELLGIHLLQIYDTEWNDTVKQEIIKSKIKHLLKQSKKIFARKCYLKEISPVVAKEFLNKNHLQGYCQSAIRVGLFYNNELVAVGTFGKPRFNKNHDYELLRYASKCEISITGGLSRLLTYTTKQFKITNIISYADRRWSSVNTNLYLSSGFTFIKTSDPNYKYFLINKKIELLSRNQFQKHKLKDKLEIYDPALSESENMSANGYYRIWDSGNLVYEWKHQQQ